MRYLSWKERKRCASELRRIYTAADADQARRVLDALTAAWAESTTQTAARRFVISRLRERICALPSEAQPGGRLDSTSAWLRKAV